MVSAAGAADRDFYEKVAAAVSEADTAYQTVHTAAFQLQVAAKAEPYFRQGYPPVREDGMPRRGPSPMTMPSPIKADGIASLPAHSPHQAECEDSARYGADLQLTGGIPTEPSANSVPAEHVEAMDEKVLQQVRKGHLTPVAASVFQQYPILATITPIVLRVKEEATKLRGLHDGSNWDRIPVKGSVRGTRRGINGISDIQHLKMPMHTVTDLAEAVVRLTKEWGEAPLFCKWDAHNAFRQFAIRAEDVPAQLIHWRGVWLWDLRNGMGMRAACYVCSIYSRFLADTVQGMFPGEVELMAYVDDVCMVLRHRAVLLYHVYIHVAGLIGLPLSVHKCKEPANEQEYLGYGHDMLRQMHYLPQRKLETLQEAIREGLRVVQHNGIKVKVRDAVLRTLAGKLSDITRVLTQGKPFMCTTFDAIKQDGALTERQTQEFRRDMLFWAAILPRLGDKAAMRRPREAQDPVITTDASVHGVGIILRAHEAAEPHRAFYHVWPEELRQQLSSKHMPLLEAVGYLMGMQEAMDDPAMREKARNGVVLVEGDCKGILQSINSGRTGNPGLQRVARELFTLALTHDLQMHTRHVPSAQNQADELSRLEDPRYPDAFTQAVTSWGDRLQQTHAAPTLAKMQCWLEDYHAPHREKTQGCGSDTSKVRRQ